MREVFEKELKWYRRNLDRNEIQKIQKQRDRGTERKRGERHQTSSMSRVYCSNNADTGTVSYTSLTYKASLALVAKVIATKLQEFSFSQRSPAVREVRANSRISLENLFSLIFLWESSPPSQFLLFLCLLILLYLLSTSCNPAPSLPPSPRYLIPYHSPPLSLRDFFLRRLFDFVHDEECV